MKFTKRVAAAAAILLAISATPSMAVTIFSDDFEGAFNVVGQSPAQWDDATGLPSPTGLATVVGPSRGGYGLSAQSMQLAGVDGQPGIDAAAVTTVVIDTLGFSNFNVSFDYSSVQTEGNDILRLLASFDGSAFVAIAGPLILGPAGTTGGDHGLPWTSISQAFSGVGQFLQLRFELLTSSRRENVFIDNVSISAVPVPAGILLLGSAFGGLALFGRLRARRTSKDAVAA